jgi:hypothetical protein
VHGVPATQLHVLISFLLRSTVCLRCCYRHYKHPEAVCCFRGFYESLNGWNPPVETPTLWGRGRGGEGADVDTFALLLAVCQGCGIQSLLESAWTSNQPPLASSLGPSEGAPHALHVQLAGYLLAAAAAACCYAAVIVGLAVSVLLDLPSAPLPEAAPSTCSCHSSIGQPPSLIGPGRPLGKVVPPRCQCSAAFHSLPTNAAAARQLPQHSCCYYRW